jgi:ABC-type dipeptide/oligopeptide/nickel transport system ATPase component
MAFTRATKKKSRARIALIGPSGSGKTIDALMIARQLVGPDGRIAVRDSEHGSAALYSDRFTFDSDEPSNHSPDSYIAAIREAEKEGYDCLILDSWSHAWAGAGGILEQSDKKGKNFNAWKDLTPQQNAMVEAILGAKIHIIATMRTKTEWIIEKVKKGDREVNEPRKIGTAPVQRQDVDYEFTVVANIDIDHHVQIDKTRCSQLDGKAFTKEGVTEIGDIIRDWLNDGEDKDEKAAKLLELFAAMKAIGKEKAAAITWINEKLNPPKGFEIRSSGDLSLPNIKKLLEDAANEKTPPAQAADQKGAA